MHEEARDVETGVGGQAVDGGGKGDEGGLLGVQVSGGEADLQCEMCGGQRPLQSHCLNLHVRLLGGFQLCHCGVEMFAPEQTTFVVIILKFNYGVHTYNTKRLQI